MDVVVIVGSDRCLLDIKLEYPHSSQRIIGPFSAFMTMKVVTDARTNQMERIVGVKWLAGAASVFLVNIQVEALDRARLLADVTRTLSEQHVNILSAAVSTTKDRVAISRFTFEMADAKHLDSVLAAVRAIEGVYDVYRT